MDIRIKKTKVRIQRGLLQLLQSTPINQLTTGDILEAAEVSRKTFYTYYRDKQALLCEISDNLVTELRLALEQDRQVLVGHDHPLDRHEIYLLAQESFAKTVKVIDAHRATLRVLLSQNGDPRIVRLIHKIAVNEFKTRSQYLFNLKNPPITIPKVPVRLSMDYMIENYVGSLIAMLVHWVRDPQPYSATKIMNALGCVQVLSPLQLVYIADDLDAETDADVVG